MTDSATPTPAPRREPTHSRDLYRLLVEAVSDYAIFALDREGYILTWNPGAERFKGYKAHEIIGKHFSIFYPQEDIDDGKPPWELRVATAEGRFEEEGWRLRKDGTRFWANVVITALRDETGELIGFAQGHARPDGAARGARARDRGCASHRAGRGREPLEERVPGRDVARAAHAAERDRRLRRAARDWAARAGERAAGASTCSASAAASSTCSASSTTCSTSAGIEAGTVSYDDRGRAARARAARPRA